MLAGFHIIWTLLLMAAFLGIVAWAWSARRREHFERAARSVLEDERPGGEADDAQRSRGNG